MIAIEQNELLSVLKELKTNRVEDKATKKARYEEEIRLKAITEVFEAVKGIKRHNVIPVFVHEVDRKFDNLILGCKAGKVYPKSSETEAGQIGYETIGAQETFAIGMPMFSQEGKFLGRLGIGFYDGLNWAQKDGMGKDIPVHYWKIEGYNESVTQEPLTYYQYIK